MLVVAVVEQILQQSKRLALVAMVAVEQAVITMAQLE
jgi:hypothetical protein